MHRIKPSIAFAVDATLVAAGNCGCATRRTVVDIPRERRTAFTPLDLSGAAANVTADTLETSVPAGDGLVFLNDNQGAFALNTNLLVLDRTDEDLREVRRIGEFGEIDLATPVYEAYGRDTMVRTITTADTVEGGAAPARALITADPVANDTSVDIDDVTGLEVGHAIRISDAVNQDDVFITQITPATGTIDFTPPLQNGYADADPTQAVIQDHGVPLDPKYQCR